MGQDIYLKYMKSKGSGDKYERLKKETMEKIIEQRIYQADRLEEVYYDMLNENSDLNQERLEKIWGEIMNDLNA